MLKYNSNLQATYLEQQVAYETYKLLGAIIHLTSGARLTDYIKYKQHTYDKITICSSIFHSSNIIYFEIMWLDTNENYALGNLSMETFMGTEKLIDS